MPLLDIVAAGPDQVAAKSAALATSALVCNHTANQDAVRCGLSLAPLLLLTLLLKHNGMLRQSSSNLSTASLQAHRRTLHALLCKPVMALQCITL